MRGAARAHKAKGCPYRDRSLLSLRAALPCLPHRSAHCSMGEAQVQTTQVQPRPCMGLACRRQTAAARTIRALAERAATEGSACKSRMTGDCHVRFCERRGVRFPPATRLLELPLRTCGAPRPLSRARRRRTTRPRPPTAWLDRRSQPTRRTRGPPRCCHRKSQRRVRPRSAHSQPGAVIVAEKHLRQPLAHQ